MNDGFKKINDGGLVLKQDLFRQGSKINGKIAVRFFLTLVILVHFKRRRPCHKEDNPRLCSWRIVVSRPASLVFPAFFAKRK